ncbi:uncharacterized protein TRUGW13939_10244 [Talaromyces rugulosus]|uniref:Transcription factor domain-containing protein n=1 Tax=Talaromyces rugulosus TaxID=121627 RepID=A0A7H8R9U5_TALRU|nr:uncharacterized protein TRUGW13939_10244 [Talaromyces rugulosus]QKX63076.1 hypothetical protein TRUGW13939_10244 [Talaromyces rugulosus]
MHKDRRRKRDTVPTSVHNRETAEETGSSDRAIDRVPPYRLTLPRFNGTVEGAELLLLAPLTSVHIGRAAREYLSSNLLRFILPSLGEEASYVTHVPCRLGHEVALDHAVQCVVAAFHALHSQSSSKQKTLSLYMRALNSLQQAINDPERSLSAETLCATELLCLFEYLTNDIDKAWLQHTRGAALLIEHRGPEMFTTEFEMSLLIGQMGIITTESYFDSKHCFLEQDAWMSTLQSAISPNSQFSDRSERVISLYESLIELTGLFSDCITIVMNPDEHDGVLYETLVRKVYTRREALSTWYHRWSKNIPNEMEDKTSSPMTDGPYLWPQILVTYQACVLMTNRMLVALDRTLGYLLEPESLEIAGQILTIRSSRQTDIRAGSMMASLSVAHSILDTAEDWHRDIVDVDLSAKRAYGKPVLISPEKFRHWVGLMGVNI